MGNERAFEWLLSTDQVLGQWRVLEPIGRGGMGEVYRVRHQEDARPAALKILKPALAKEEDFRARFFEEIAVHAKIRSPNVVHLHGADVTSGIPWMALELLSGTTLSRLLRHYGRLSHVAVLNILSEVADGVVAIHALGALHRDLKPANIFITTKGEVKVLDLGTTKIVGGGMRPMRPATEVGSVVGTFTYMAPEQLLGERVGYACDVYALGVLGYIAMSARHPFEEGDGDMNMQALAFRIATTEPNPLPEILPGCSEAVWDFIRRLMAKDPDDRPPSMAHVAAEARSLRNRLSVEMGIDPHGRLTELVAEVVPNVTPAPQPLESTTNPVFEDPRVDADDLVTDAATRKPTALTPTGTVQMEPVPDEVRAFVATRRDAGGKAVTPHRSLGTLPMNEIPSDVQRHPAATSRAVAMNADRSSLRPALDRRHLVLGAAAALTLGGAILYRLLTSTSTSLP